MLFHQERPLSLFAADWRASRGRLLSEPASPTRSDFQRDRDRIIHSNAFRRLKHKTQVFVEHEGDHYRTRLTHSLEVGQIARAIARILGLDEDLAETLALAHDLGHTPFGHAGEDALDAAMQAWGGFDHNAQTLRIVTRLEHRYAAFDGLNLTWETLEGLVKHNGPLLDSSGAATPRYAKHGIPGAIVEFEQVFPLEIASFASAEAQAAAIADDIAYDAHDIDDAIRAGLIAPEDLREVPLVADQLDEIEARWPGLDKGRKGHEIMRRIITLLVEDAAQESERRLVALAPRTDGDIRAADHAVIAFSPEIAERERALKQFMFRRVYRHPHVNTMRTAADTIITDLFGHYKREPSAMNMPPIPDEARHARRVADYIAGMTDRFAIQEHQRLFASTPALR